LNSEILSKEFELLKTELIIAYDAKGMRSSGKWANSLEVTAIENSVKLMGEDYSQQLETGRQAGQFPPIEAIKQWIIDKGVFGAILQEISLSSLAFLIARKIAREGWKRQKYGGVELISEIITDQRIQRIINEVGAVMMVKYTTELVILIKELQEVA
jgi:hypothetical protein